MYTYIAPTVTDVAGLSESRVPLYLLAFGLGMVVGTPLGGRLADWSVFRSHAGLGSVLMGLTLVAFTVTSQWFVPGLLTVFVLSRVSSVLVVEPADAADAGRRRRADHRRRDEPRLAQHRQRPRCLARRRRRGRRLRLHRDELGRRRPLARSACSSCSPRPPLHRRTDAQRARSRPRPAGRRRRCRPRCRRAAGCCCGRRPIRMKPARSRTRREARLSIAASAESRCSPSPPSSHGTKQCRTTSRAGLAWSGRGRGRPGGSSSRAPPRRRCWTPNSDTWPR